MQQVKTTITSQQLREAAEKALQLHEFLDKCNREGVTHLMAFDLDYLAGQFEAAADRCRL